MVANQVGSSQNAGIWCGLRQHLQIKACQNAKLLIDGVYKGCSKKMGNHSSNPHIGAVKQRVNIRYAHSNQRRNVIYNFLAVCLLRRKRIQCKLALKCPVRELFFQPSGLFLIGNIMAVKGGIANFAATVSISVTQLSINN